MGKNFLNTLWNFNRNRRVCTFKRNFSVKIIFCILFNFHDTIFFYKPTWNIEMIEIHSRNQCVVQWTNEPIIYEDSEIRSE